MQNSWLQNKTVVIVGGTSGLGFETAKSVINVGGSVVIGGSHSSKLTDALTQLGNAAMGDTLNMLDENSIHDFFTQIDTIDHLVITASILRPGLFLEASVDDLRINMESRFWGSVHAIRAAAPKLSQTGSIILTSGMVTQRPQKGKALAAVAASAVEMLAHSLVAELAPRRINVINPGPMKTPLLFNALGQDEAKLAMLAQTLPLKRVGEPIDYAKTALFLMSNANMNGEVIHLNGGAAWA